MTYTYDQLLAALQLGHRKGYGNAVADVVSGELHVVHVGPEDMPEARWQQGADEASCTVVCEEWLKEAGIVPSLAGEGR